MQIQTLTFTDGTTIVYELSYKKIRNINLRIGIDGIIKVSAPKGVPLTRVEKFLSDKQAFIFRAKNRAEKMKKEELLTEVLPDKKVIYDKFFSILSENFPLFAAYKIPFPTLKVRKMNSRWGSCNVVKKIITLNSRLYFKEDYLIKYVVLHELSHLVYADHSKNFYAVLKSVMPDYKQAEKLLNK